MNIKFNEKAHEALLKLIGSKENAVIRLEVLAVGCGEPALALCLDKQKNDDDFINIEGITFVTQEKFKIHFENTEILYNPEAFNNGFYVHRLHI